MPQDAAQGHNVPTLGENGLTACDRAARARPGLLAIDPSLHMFINPSHQFVDDPSLTFTVNIPSVQCSSSKSASDLPFSQWLTPCRHVRKCLHNGDQAIIRMTSSGSTGHNQSPTL